MMNFAFVQMYIAATILTPAHFEAVWYQNVAQCKSAELCVYTLGQSAWWDGSMRITCHSTAVSRCAICGMLPCQYATAGMLRMFL